LLLPDRRDDRHPLVPTTCLSRCHRVATNGFVFGGRFGALSRRLPKRLGSHRHALAVHRRNLQTLGAERVVGRGSARLVERLEVGGGANDLLLALPLRNVAAGISVDPLDAPLERGLDGRLRDAPAQRKRVDLLGQAQLFVHREASFVLTGKRQAVTTNGHPPVFVLQKALADAHRRPRRSRPVLNLLLLPLEQRIQVTLKRQGTHARESLVKNLGERHVMRRSGLRQLPEHDIELLARIRVVVDGCDALCCHPHGRAPRLPVGTSFRTAWASPARVGGWTALKPCSSCEPSAPAATGTNTGAFTSRENTCVTTPRHALLDQVGPTRAAPVPLAASLAPMPGSFARNVAG